MSWSLKVQGTKSEIKNKAAVEFDRAAKMYEGQEEEKDVLAVKERMLVEVEQFPDNVLAPDSVAPNGYDVTVYAYGSRTAGQGWCSVHGECNRAPRET